MSPTRYRTLKIATERGGVACHYYPTGSGYDRAVIWVGGIGGGFDTPARSLYPNLASQLARDGIASMRVSFQSPGDLFSCVMDVLTAITFLSQQAFRSIGLVGHSFGGAVVIQAAAQSSLVKTVITLATQSVGAESVRHLRPDCSILLIHGTEDAILPDRSSRFVYEQAHHPKALHIYRGAGHVLDEAAEMIRHEVAGWLRRELDLEYRQRISA